MYAIATKSAIDKTYIYVIITIVSIPKDPGLMGLFVYKKSALRLI